MDETNQQAKILSKKYLVALGLVLPLLLFASKGMDSFRYLLGSFMELSTPPSSPKSESGAAYGGGGRTSADADNWEQIREDIEEFNRWFQSDATAPPAVVRIVRPSDEEDLGRIQGPSALRVEPVRISNTISSDETGWSVRVGLDRLVPGARLAATGTRVGYEVLKVSRNSVWLMALGPDAPPPGTAALNLPPDIGRVKGLSATKDLWLELAGERRYAKGHRFSLASGGHLEVVALWLEPNAVHFRYEAPGRPQRHFLYVAVQ